MGFSWIGTLIGFLLTIPSILFAIKLPPKNIPERRSDASLFFTIMERIGQAGCLLILVTSKVDFQEVRFSVSMFLMLLCVFIYYGLWIRYIVKGQDYAWLWRPLGLIPVPMAVFPVCAFGLAALWINSLWLGLAVFVLAVGHLTVSWYSYKQLN